MIQFLFEDYAFMAIFLDSNMLATELQFDLNSFKASLKYNDVHKSRDFISRFQNLINSIENAKNMLNSQCQKLKWKKSCEIASNLQKIDFNKIAKEELSINEL